MLKNYLKITWQILKRKKLYSIITLSGIVIPVVFIVIVSSFLTHIINYQSPASDFKRVIYLDKIVWKNISDDGKVTWHWENSATLPFIKKYVKTLKSPAKVAAVSANGWDEKETIYLKNRSFDVFMKYTDLEFWEITDFQFLYGRAYNRSEFQKGERVIVIDEKTSISYFGYRNSIGKTMVIDHKNYRITGVIENVDATMYRIAANMYLPFTSTNNYRSNQVSTDQCYALIMLNKKSDFDAVNEEFQQKLTTFNFSEISPSRFNTVKIRLERDTLFAKILKLLQHFFHYDKENYKEIYIYGVVLIFLLLIFPAINLIYINVSRFHERLSEIGVRKTFGSTVLHLFYQLLFESVLVAIAGGVFSFIISVIILKLINHAELFPGMYLQFNYSTMFLSLAMIFLLGILTGLLPSIILSRSKIIHSLGRS